MSVMVLATARLPMGKVGPIGRLAAVIAMGCFLGCSLTPPVASVVASKSTVVAQTAGSNDLSTSWLESATLSYAQYETSGPIVQASNEEKAVVANQILGVRYPHPDGRSDHARVELVVGKSTDEVRNSSWHTRLGNALDATLPGVAWGTGIRQAKAIDLKLSELHPLLLDIQRCTAPDRVDLAPKSQVQFASEINGQRHFARTAPIRALDELASRVAREGKLITLAESWDDLQAGLQSAAEGHLASHAAGDSQPNVGLALAPLPPVTTR